MRRKQQNARTLKCHNKMAICIATILTAFVIVLNIMAMKVPSRSTIAQSHDINVTKVGIEEVKSTPATNEASQQADFANQPKVSCTLEEVDSNPWATPIGLEYQVSKNDFVQLCNLVGREYGADFVPVEEKAKVVMTVLNRVKSPYFPDTIEGVITQPGQYEGELSRGYYSDKVTYSVRLAVLYALNGNVQNSYIFYWGDGMKNHFYTYDEYEFFARDLTNFKNKKNN